MKRPRFASVLIGFIILAGCGHPAVSDPAAAPSELEGRWITVAVANATDTESELAVVDEDDPTRIVGAVQPATTHGQSREQHRLFVPDDVSWVVTSNGVGALYAEMVDGWCGDLPITINLAEGIVDAAVPAYVHSGPGNCVGSVPPVRLTLYMRDASVLGVGWKLVSGENVRAQGVVSEQPTARCVVVPYDWELHLWTQEDFMERRDILADAGTSAADWVPAPDMALSIDIPVIPLPEVAPGAPGWWQGAQPECPELPEPSETPRAAGDPLPTLGGFGAKDDAQVALGLRPAPGDCEGRTGPQHVVCTSSETPDRSC